jgi:hypothetical protein
MQISSQIDEPDYGTLLDDMLYVARPARCWRSRSRFIAPRVEVELAFVLKAPLKGPNVTVEDVLNATDYITPAIEIIDARIEQFDRHTKVMRKVYDTISDNAANAGIVIGADPAFKADPRRWTALVRRHPAAERRGRRNRPGRRCAGHPAIGIAWLANKLAPWGERWRPARSCWPAASRGRWPPRRATCLKPTTALSVTAEQAAALVQAMRYPQDDGKGGIRGMAGARASRWGRYPNYAKEANSQVCLLVQVESKTALDNLEAIAATPGVDGVFIGPADLSASLGYIGQATHPEVQKAIDDAIRRIVRCGKAAGILVSDEQLARHYLEIGASFVAVGLDTQILVRQTSALAALYKDDLQPLAAGDKTY